MRISLALLLLVALAGCASKPAAPPKPKAAPTANWRDAPMPDVWLALVDTSKGSLLVEVHKDWAPKGAQHFWELVNTGYFNDTRIFRVRPDFIVQFGISGDPQLTAMINSKPIDDDPRTQKNVKGTLAFAQSGKNTRRSQIYVNLKDNPELDTAGFAPFARVKEGFDNLEKLYAGYGEWNPPGSGPNASRIQTEGNKYLDASFPRLDRITRVKAVGRK